MGQRGRKNKSCGYASPYIEIREKLIDAEIKIVNRHFDCPRCSDADDEIAIRRHGVDDHTEDEKEKKGGYACVCGCVCVCACVCVGGQQQKKGNHV